MAKRNSTRRKARKPKFIEVEGHHLTEAQHADLQICIERRTDTNHGEKITRIEELALGDFLAGYRPSRKIERQLIALSQTTSSVSLAIGTLRSFPWYASGAIRFPACKLLREFAQELSNSASVLSALATGVELEADMKIQGWLDQAALLEQIGCSQEFAHGNC